MSEDKRVEQEDRELIQRMASKDADALDAFYTRYNRLAFGLVFRIVGNRPDAEDVLTDVFWQVWQQAPRYDSSRGKPIAWLLTIARTRAIDCLRSTNRQHTRNDDFEEERPPSPRRQSPTRSLRRIPGMPCAKLCKHFPNNREYHSKWHTFRG